MRREHCEHPLRVYSHIAPYMSGPEKIMNTNGNPIDVGCVPCAAGLSNMAGSVVSVLFVLPALCVMLANSDCNTSAP